MRNRRPHVASIMGFVMCTSAANGFGFGVLQLVATTSMMLNKNSPVFWHYQPRDVNLIKFSVLRTLLARDTPSLVCRLAVLRHANQLRFA